MQKKRIVLCIVVVCLCLTIAIFLAYSLHYGVSDEETKIIECTSTQSSDVQVNVQKISELAEEKYENVDNAEDIAINIEPNTQQVDASEILVLEN